MCIRDRVVDNAGTTLIEYQDDRFTCRGKCLYQFALVANGGVITDASSDALIKYMTIAFSFGQEAYSDYRGNSLSQLLLSLIHIYVSSSTRRTTFARR